MIRINKYFIKNTSYMKKSNYINKSSDSLFKAILSLKDLDEARRFFRDLLTEEEIKEFSNRWAVAQMLAANVSYTRIEKETGMSSTTIARIAKWLNKGMNGYKIIISRLNISSKHTHPETG